MRSSRSAVQTVLIGTLLHLVALACASPAGRGADSTVPSGAAARAEGDSARLARLEREARALVRTTGCEAASSCRTAPVGVRGCGGPRDYAVYCAATTDTVALFGKLGELERAEAQLNERTGAVSTCEMRLPPSVGLQGGSCAATP